jgi:hypothetical protein
MNHESSASARCYIIVEKDSKPQKLVQLVAAVVSSFSHAADILSIPSQQANKHNLWLWWVVGSRVVD